MIRLFNTHDVRQVEEISGLWQMVPEEGSLAGKEILTMVPGCWENIPGLENYQGKAVYRKTIHCGGNVRLVFKGVSHTADVYFDQVHVAHHYNAYTSFDAVIPNVKEGKHQIEVLVDNHFSEDSALHVPNDYQTYGGIIRPVVLEQVSDVYVEWVHAQPVKKDGLWELKIEAKIKNIGRTKKEIRLVSEIEGNIVNWDLVQVQEEAVVSTTLLCKNVEDYLPDSPHLYLVSTRVYEKDQVIDDLIERVGFRMVQVSGNQILWNGRPIRIKGFCRHEDHAQFGCALPVEAMMQDLSLMRDMNANAVRTSHYPNDERFLDLCDELGIMVWEENHARGLEEPAMRNPNFREQCLNCTEEMVMQDYNHPSIFIWGIMNECASETQYGRMCYEEQFAKIKSIDNSRPVTFASCRFNNDICLDLVDVVSYNMYPLWYSPKQPHEYAGELYEYAQTHGGKGKPFIISEVGAGAIYGYRSEIRPKWSEERQAEVIRKQIQEVMNIPEFSGMFIWQFCDVRVSEEWAMSRPRTMNNKGIVDEYRRKKLSYSVVQDEYSRYKGWEK